MKKKLAQITSACFNLQDRGIFILDIFVDYENGWSQGVCNLCIDTYDKEKGKRVGTGKGMDLIISVLNLFGCNNLNELRGKHCFVLLDEKKDKVIGIESLRCDGSKQLIYEDIFK